jgi:hypothetical protein
MKNQYFGDINDYLKYGILLELSGRGFLCTGLCWMLTGSDNRTDGSSLKYLQNPDRHRGYSPDLFDLLHQAVVIENDRNVSRLEQSTVLPGAIFYPEILPDSRTGRTQYFRDAERILGKSDWVFFDPDNGLEVPSILMGRKNSSKFLYWLEVESAYASGKSVLIYQHFPRVQRVPYIESLIARLTSRLGISTAFSFRTTRVVFLLAPQPSHLSHFRSRSIAVAATWGHHIAVLEHHVPALSPSTPLQP